MDILVRLIICALAVFRLAELFVIDSGPFDVFMNLRGSFNRVPFDNSLRRNIANLLLCVHCTGFWLAFMFGLFFASSFANYILFSLAIAGLQSIFANSLGRQR